MSEQLAEPDGRWEAEAPADALMLTIPQAAALLQIGESLCRELVSSGRMPSRRLGVRCIRVPRASLEAWAIAEDRGPE